MGKGLLSFTKVHEARILKLVIPAQAGIHWAVDGRKMDPRFREDDVSFAKAITHFSNAR
jgi:hypothetical protein